MPSPAVPLNGVAVEIASQALAGKHRFEIRLDPPELGRIDVKLDIDSDGNVTSRLVVERSRHARPAQARRAASSSARCSRRA